MLKNAFILFAVAFIILILFLPTFSKMQDIKQKDLEYQKRIADLTAENKKLLEEKQKLEEDPVYLEKIAREKMGLIREGETIYQLMPMNAVE